MRLLIITPTLGESSHLNEAVGCINRLDISVQHILCCPHARISELTTRFPQSRVVCDQGEKAGIYGAINAGLAAAHEPWDFFTYLNDDDLLGKDFTAMFKRHGVPGHLNTVGFGCISNIDRSGRKMMRMTVGPDVRQYPALLQIGISPTGQQGMVFGRKVVEGIGSVLDTLQGVWGLGLLVQSDGRGISLCLLSARSWTIPCARRTDFGRCNHTPRGTQIGDERQLSKPDRASAEAVG